MNLGCVVFKIKPRVFSKIQGEVIQSKSAFIGPRALEGLVMRVHMNGHD